MYDGMQAAIGDEVFHEGVLQGTVAQGTVVYVGKTEFVVEFQQLLHREFIWVFHRADPSRLQQRDFRIRVNGFLVPAPAEQFTDDLAYIAAPGHVEFHYAYMIGRTITQEIKLLFERGVLHRSAANAIAHAKAMVGIDPYARESLDDAWDERPVPPAGEGLSRPESDAVRPTPPEGSSL